MSRIMTTISIPSATLPKSFTFASTIPESHGGHQPDNGLISTILLCRVGKSDKICLARHCVMALPILPAFSKILFWRVGYLLGGIGWVSSNCREVLRGPMRGDGWRFQGGGSVSRQPPGSEKAVLSLCCACQIVISRSLEDRMGWQDGASQSSSPMCTNNPDWGTSTPVGVRSGTYRRPTKTASVVSTDNSLE